MTVPAAPAARPFDPREYSTFRFVDRTIDDAGEIALHYALDDAFAFTERITVPTAGHDPEDPVIQGLLSLLHWVAGVSYYKAAIPPAVSIAGAQPTAAAARLLEALYSEGLGEFAVVNRLEHLPRPRFPRRDGAPDRPDRPDRRDGAPDRPDRPDHRSDRSPEPPSRVLVPVGGGKDSAVAIEIVRRSGLDEALFSVGDAQAIAGTARAAGLPRYRATRRIDPALIALNGRGALNGHVPITAIVSCIALLAAALNGYDTVALANERSASAGNTSFDGIEVNHQFSKSLAAERLLADAVAGIDGAPRIFSILRPASELAIARAFARLPQYHPVFTSCNRIFQIDPARRLSSWCGECDKCRFVFLILAPFLTPDALYAIFGRAMLNDPDQYDGFALLTATGGHKPFECVGEVADSVAALRLIADQPHWRGHRVADRLIAEVLPLFGEADAEAGTDTPGDPAHVFALTPDHLVPGELIPHVDALLGA